MDPEQLRRGLEFLAREPTGQATAAEILALAARYPDDADTPLAVTTVRADGWLGDLLSGGAVESLQPVEPPPGFTATLRPYQQRGLSWLAFLSSLGLGSCLADDMGLGPTLLLCPMSLVDRSDHPGAGRMGAVDGRDLFRRVVCHSVGRCHAASKGAPHDINRRALAPWGLTQSADLFDGDLWL